MRKSIFQTNQIKEVLMAFRLEMINNNRQKK